MTPELVEALDLRDGGCVAPRLGLSTAPCGSQFGPGSYFARPEVEHIDTGGLGKRGPSTMENLVLLCGYHHRLKTESARSWRHVLREYAVGLPE